MHGRKAFLCLGLTLVVLACGASAGEESTASTVGQAAGSLADYRAIESRLAVVEQQLHCPAGVVCDHCGGCCDSGGCGGYDPCCPPCGFFYAGYDHVLAQPYFSRNLAVWDMAPATLRFESFDWDIEYTPRGYVGYESPCGTGFRLRYWQFDHETRFARTEQPGENLFIEVNAADQEANLTVTGTLNAVHAIELRVADFEVTKRSVFCWGWLAGSGGVRYARLEQTAFWSETGGPQTVFVRHDFEGLGPSLLAEGGVHLFGGIVSAFANVRTSLLMGERSVITQDDVMNGDDIPAYESLLPILEGQVGLESSGCLFGYHTTLRAALEAQAWFRGGSASGGDDEGSPADLQDLGFLGLSVSTIIRF